MRRKHKIVPKQSLRQRITNAPDGSALIAVLFFGLIIAVVIAALMTFATQKRRETARLIIFNEELVAAENAIERFVAQVHFAAINRTPQAWNTEGGMAGFIEEGVGNVTDQNFNIGFTFERLIDASSEGLTLITDQMATDIPDLAPWRNYFINIDSYRVLVGAVAYTDGGLAMAGQMTNRSGVYLARTVNFYLVPLFNYAIFYDNALELDGGARIDVYGKVHTNQDWYLTSSSSVAYHDYATVAGNFYGGIYHPLDSARRTWSGSTQVDVASRVGALPGSAADQLRRVNTSDITINNGWLSSVNYNNSPGNPNNWTLNPNWVDDSLRMFNGILKDSSHGVEPVRLPIGEENRPDLIIQPPRLSGPQVDNETERNAKMAYQAAVIIEMKPTFGASNPRNAGGTASWTMNNANNVSNYVRAYTLVPDSNEPTGFREVEFDLTYRRATDGPNTQRTFVEHTRIYNGREEKLVDMLDINMDRFREYLQSTTVGPNGQINLQNTLNPDGADALIYVHAPQTAVPTGRQAAARLTDAARIDNILAESGLNASTGMTIATNAPLYTKGHVNNQQPNGHVPLLLAGDSINILSSSFDDAQYLSNNSGNGANRNAANRTDTNAVFIAGNVATRQNQYSGGGENFFRYLENWGSRTHYFRGSMLNLFESQIATGPWDKNSGTGVNSGYYGAPRRDWGWDANFASGNVPPGMPTTAEYSMGRWEQITRAEFIEAGGPTLAVRARP